MIRETTKPDGKTRLRVRGVFSKIDEVNENKRRYSRKVWESVLREDGQFMKRLKQRRVLGMLEHPTDGSTKSSEASHILEKVWIEGDKVMGEAVILKTPQGLIVEELYDVGFPIGISSRGYGDVHETEDGIQDVMEDYVCETFDLVCDPSFPDALPQPVFEAAMKKAHERAEAECTLTSLITEQDEEEVGGPPEDIIPDVGGEEPPSLGDAGEEMSATKKAEELKQTLEDVVEGEVDIVQAVEIFSGIVKMIRDLAVEAEENPQADDLLNDLINLHGDLGQKVVEMEQGSETQEEAPEEELPPPLPLGDEPEEPFSESNSQTKKESSMKKTKGKSTASPEDITLKADVVENLAERLRKARQRIKEMREGVPRERFQAAVSMAAGLLVETRQAQKSLKEASNEIEELKILHEAGVELGISLVKEGRSERVRTYIESAIVLNPSLEKVRNTLAESKTVKEAKVKVGELSEAISGSSGDSSSPPPLYSSGRDGSGKQLQEAGSNDPYEIDGNLMGQVDHLMESRGANQGLATIKKADELTEDNKRSS